MQQIQIGQEFRIKIPNSRITKVQSDFSGTPVHIRCIDQTGLVPPEIVLIPEDNIAQITFDSRYDMGMSYTFIVGEQEKVVKEYQKPPSQFKKSIAGQQYFRSEINKSQESLNQVFSSSNALSFDQSFYNRTLGQIVIQGKLEDKYGPLHEKYKLFSGAGFGSLQMFSCALGYETEELNRWFLENFFEALYKNIFEKVYELATSVLLNHNHERRSVKKAEKEIRYFFKAKDVSGKRTNRDLTVKECKSDIFLPLWDMSRRMITITKNIEPGKPNYSDMPIYAAACMAVFDPVFFKTKSKKRYIKELGIMNIDVVKNNDVYLKMYNKSMSVTSIGSPVRCFDKGIGDMDDRSITVKLLDIKHDTDLDWARDCGSMRYECTPIDELSQFPKNKNSIHIAQKSGDIDV
jgi:hypothetical protein